MEVTRLRRCRENKVHTGLTQVKFIPAAALEGTKSHTLPSAGNGLVLAPYMYKRTLDNTPADRASFGTPLGASLQEPRMPTYPPDSATPRGEIPLDPCRLYAEVSVVRSRRQRRLHLEEQGFLSERQYYGVAVSGSVQHVGLRATIHHRSGHRLGLLRSLQLNAEVDR